MAVRLVACDLDGTLLRRDGTISGRTRAAWLAAAAAGFEMLVVTARPPRYLHAVADALTHASRTGAWAGIAAAVGFGAPAGIGAPVGFGAPAGIAVCANGAVRYDLATRRVIDIRPLSRDLAELVVTAVSAVAPGVGFAVETGSRVVFEPGFAKPDNGDLRRAVADLADLWLHGSPIVKLLAWSAELTADALLAVVRAAAGDAVECTHSGGRGLVEVSAVGVSKVAALTAYCADLGIDRSEVVAFGDMPNDLAMLQWAGRGYAVANAHPSVLTAGLPLAAANDHDGVALVLERLLTEAAVRRP